MDTMTLTGEAQRSTARLADKDRRRIRNAMARRNLERMRDEKALQYWLADIWDMQDQRS